MTGTTFLGGAARRKTGLQERSLSFWFVSWWEAGEGVGDG